MSVYSFCSRDGSIPVSFIQKLLVKKLGLKSEDEVILCWICKIHSCNGNQIGSSLGLIFIEPSGVLAFAILLSLKFSALL